MAQSHLAVLMGSLSSRRQEVQVQFQPEAQVSEGSVPPR